MTGHSGRPGYRRRRRAAHHAPNGMASSPSTNTTGTAMKISSPMYGFATTPSASSSTRTTNSTAIVVAMTIPMSDTGLRAASGSRNDGGTAAALLQRLEVGHQIVEVI